MSDAPPATRARDPLAVLRRSFDRGLLIRSLVLAAAVVVLTLVVAAVALVLAAVGVGLSADPAGAAGEPGSGTLQGVDVSGFPPLTALMAVAGSMHFGRLTGVLASGPSSPLAALGISGATARFGVALPMPALLLPVLLVAAGLAARIAPPGRQALTARVLGAAITGAASALVLLLLALLGSSGASVDGVRLTATAAGAPLVLGAFLSSAVAALAGTSVAGGAADRGPAALVRRTIGLLRALPAWAAAPALVLAVWSAVLLAAALVALVVGAVVQGDPVLGFGAPLLLGLAAVDAAAIGQLGALGFDAHVVVGAQRTGPDGLASVLENGTAAPWLWVLPVVTLLAAVASAVALDRVRGDERRPLWLLPAVAVVGWAVLPPVLAAVRGSADVVVGGATATAAVELAVAPWTALVAGVWALAVEVGARWAVPAWRRPRSSTGRRIRIASAVAVGAVLLVAAGGAASAVVGGTLLSPRGAADAYLRALADGDEAAVHDVAGTGRVLPLPDAASDRLQQPSLGAVTTSGDDATVDVSFTVGGSRIERTLELSRRGMDGIVPRWVVAAPLVTEVSVRATPAETVLVGGRRLDAADGVATARLLPGRYPVAAPGEAAAYVAFDPGSVTAGGAAPLAVEQTATAALQEAVSAQVRDRVASCARSTEAMPSGCPFSLYVFTDYRRLRWTVREQPTVRLSGATWTATGGSVSAAYEQEDFFGGGWSKQTQSVPMSPQNGTVAVDAEGATVRTG